MVDVNKLKGEIVSQGLTQKSVYERIGLSKKKWFDRIAKKCFSSDEIYKICEIIGMDKLPIFFV